ncbi:hypothetical protein BDD12DRAFT_982239 [Trichophaea hybrida]|nr:hypothetical protein BDD12DRAFT_982239 [Trichophaea hybrida]
MCQHFQVSPPLLASDWWLTFTVTFCVRIYFFQNYPGSVKPLRPNPLMELPCRIEGWRIPAYYSSVDQDLDNVITITKIGVAHFVAKRAVAFLDVAFPSVGRQLLQLISDLCAEITKREKMDKDEKVTITRWLELDVFPYSRLCLHATACYSFLEVSIQGAGPAAYTSEIFRAVHWIVAAFVPRDKRSGLYSSRIRVSPKDTGHLELTALTNLQVNDCWTKMLAFACIVDYENNPNCPLDPGLTLDFELLTMLAGVEREVLSSKGVFLVGFDTALIPLRPLEKKRWHFLFKPGQQITSQDIASLDCQPLTSDNYLRGTVSVGWCTTAIVAMGTSMDGVNTNISNAAPALGLEIEAENIKAIQFQLGAQVGIGGSALTGSIAYKRQITRTQAAVVAVRSPAENFDELITQASPRRLLVFDTVTERAWLVPAVSVLLFASLCLIYQREYRLEDEFGGGTSFTYASKAHDAQKSAMNALEANRNIFMRRMNSGTRMQFNDLVKGVWYDMARGENLCRNQQSRRLLYNGDRLIGYDLSEAILSQPLHLRGVKIDSSMGNWAVLTKEIPVVFVADIGQVIQTTLCTSSCSFQHETKGLLSCTVHDFLAAFGCNWRAGTPACLAISTEHDWVLTGNPFENCSNPSGVSTDPCVYCSELHRIQAIRSGGDMQMLDIVVRWFRKIIQGRRIVPRRSLEYIRWEGTYPQSLLAKELPLPKDGAVRFGTLLSASVVSFRVFCTAFLGLSSSFNRISGLWDTTRPGLLKVKMCEFVRISAMSGRLIAHCGGRSRMYLTEDAAREARHISNSNSLGKKRAQMCPVFPGGPAHRPVPEGLPEGQARSLRQSMDSPRVGSTTRRSTRNGSALGAALWPGTVFEGARETRVEIYLVTL